MVSGTTAAEAAAADGTDSASVASLKPRFITAVGVYVKTKGKVAAMPAQTARLSGIMYARKLTDIWNGDVNSYS